MQHSSLGGKGERDYSERKLLVAWENNNRRPVARELGLCLSLSLPPRMRWISGGSVAFVSWPSNDQSIISMLSYDRLLPTEKNKPDFVSESALLISWQLQRLQLILCVSTQNSPRLMFLLRNACRLYSCPRRTDGLSISLVTRCCSPEGNLRECGVRTRKFRWRQFNKLATLCTWHTPGLQIPAFFLRQVVVIRGYFVHDPPPQRCSHHLTR